MFYYLLKKEIFKCHNIRSNCEIISFERKLGQEKNGPTLPVDFDLLNKCKQQYFHGFSYFFDSDLEKEKRMPKI